MMKRFLFYGLVGWCLEIMWTGLESLVKGDLRLMGFTNLWMFLIYGSAVLLEPLHDFIAHWRWPARGFFWMMVIWGVEYFSGLILATMLGVYPWYYTDSLAIGGLITLRFAPVWFVTGLFFERVHRALDTLELANSRRRDLRIFPKQ